MGGEVFHALPLAQSTISQHLGVLKRAGLVRATRQGTRMLYCITDEPLAGLRGLLDTLIEQHPVCTGEEH
ncbi:MAG: Regulatory protein [Actinobacteria bacterium 66_15]|nr:MAG: Regulatory protein [Actinobacteria bacterium 66_15]